MNYVSPMEWSYTASQVRWGKCTQQNGTASSQADGGAATANDIAGIAELGEARRRMRRMRIRWAASVSERGVKELKEVAEKILRSNWEEDTILRWTEGVREKIQQVDVLEDIPEGGVYTDGSRIDGQTAAATITEATFLGRYATVMDAEMLAIAIGWEIGSKVITDSQGAIGRIQNIEMERPKEWIEERVVRAAREGGKKIAWVKGHSRVLGNELADLRAKKEAWVGVRRGDRNIAAAGGIRHEFRVTENKAGTRMG